MRPKPNRSQKGFTLIEVMVTLMVLVIILGYAIPNMTDQIRDNRSLTFGEEFAGALSYARTEALKRGGLVSICASNVDRDGCGNDWTNGWLVFVDTDSGGETGDSPTIANEAAILRLWDPAAAEMELGVSRGGDSIRFVRFNAQGGLPRNSDQPIFATAKHGKCTGNSARRIRVTLAGSVRAAREDC